MHSELPFDIKSSITDRSGAVQYIATINGEQAAIGRYKPGDSDKRKKLATEWSKNDSLRNGKLLTVQQISQVLQCAELKAIPRIEEVRDNKDNEQTEATTEAASYADSNLIAEIAWNCQSQAIDFIVYDRQTQSVSRESRVETSIGILAPPACCKGVVTPGGSIPGTVLVPTEYDETGLDEGVLRADMQAFIERYVELPGDAAALAVEYDLLSWIHDTFSELPYLGFRTVDIGRGKTRALRTVGWLCYRPIICGGGSTAAATLRLLDIFGGTLLGDEYDQRDTDLAAELSKILNQGFEANLPLVRCDGERNQPKPFRCFGPKVFVLRKGFMDDATESRMITIKMHQRTRADIPLTLPQPQFDKQALALRNRLLAWRFANLGKISVNPDHADPRLEDRMNQIGMPLMAVAKTEEGRARVVTALRQQQKEIATNRADSLPAEVLEAALAIAGPDDPVRPGNVAGQLNRHRADVRGVTVDKLSYRDRISPEKIGWVLRKVLEIPRERDRDGVYYLLANTRVRQLCDRFGLVSSPETANPQHLHSEPTQKNGLFDSASGDDVGRAGRVGFPEGSDEAERAAIVSVEAEEDAAAKQQDSPQ